MLEPCFEDPDGDALTITATSSEEPVATAQVYGLEVNIQAVSPGNADVTVTATDPGGQSAWLGIGVLVPNRPPHADGELADIRMLADSTAELSIDLYFADPDGESLTFAVASDDPSVATASIQDSSMLAVGGLRHGTTTVTLAATDPGELRAERTIDVEVLEPVLIFRDDFDDFDRWDWWTFNFDARMVYRDGLLHLSSTKPLASVGRSGTEDLAEWEYRASVGVTEGADGCEVGLMSYSWPDRDMGWASFEEGAYWVRYWVPDPYQFFEEQGHSDAVRVVGEFTEMVWTSRLGVMTLAAGETVLARLDHELFAPSSPELMDQARLSMFCSDTDWSALFDWAELWAVEVGGEP